MMSHFHAVAWLDHSDAHVLHFSRDDVEASHLHAQHSHRHLHNRRAPHERHPAPVEFFDEIVHALEGAQEILVCGPGTAKTEFTRHVEHHHQALKARIFGVETVDHPSDGQLLQHARKYFKAADRMR